jgi:quercetin dioxygenase-like cupin family protein
MKSKQFSLAVKAALSSGFFLVAVIFLVGCAGSAQAQTASQNTGGTMEPIFPRGAKAPEAVFTGTAFNNMLVPDTDGIYDLQVYDVVFEAGARNNWHAHPGGQILLVTDGKGWYQERGKPARFLQRGDVVVIPPDVEHWHGAASDSEFTHIGISPNVHKGGAKWLEPVSDAEYTEATK